MDKQIYATIFFFFRIKKKKLSEIKREQAEAAIEPLKEELFKIMDSKWTLETALQSLRGLARLRLCT
jgi:hypothetical protein